MKKTWLVAVIVALSLGLTVFVSAGVKLLNWSFPLPQQPSGLVLDTLVAQGKQALFDHNILLAKEKFLAAVTADSANQEAQLLLGISRIAAIYEEGQSLDTSALDSVKEVAERCGVTFNTFTLYKTDAVLPGQLPPSAPSTGELLDFIAIKVLPELDVALQNLEKVNSPGFTSILQPPALARTGNNYTVDYADVLTIKTFIHAAKATLELLLVYDWNVRIPDIMNADPKDLQDFRKLLIDHPYFATPKEPARLTAAKLAFTNFIDTFNLANEQIGIRNVQSGHLFVLDAPITNELAAVTAASLAQFKAALVDIKASLSGPRSYSFFSGNSKPTVDLSKLFDSSIPVNIRQKAINLNTNQFLPDRTFGNIIPLGVTSPALDDAAAAFSWELTWKLVLPRQGVASIASNGSTSVAVGMETTTDGGGNFQANGIISTSTDGATWTSQNPIPGIFLGKVKWTGNAFVALGFDMAFSQVMLKSPDGVSWTPITFTSGDYYPNDLVWGNNKYVSVGFGIHNIETSSDGVTWTEQNFAEGTNLHGVTWTGSRFVAIGDNYDYLTGAYSNVVITSPDGITWTSRSLANVVASDSAGFFDIIWTGSKLAARGMSLNASTFMVEDFVVTSTDGTVWKKETLRSGNSLEMFGMSPFNNLAWGGGQFMALVPGGMLTSPDTVNWTGRKFLSNSYFGSCAYGNNRFLVVSNKGVYAQTGVPVSSSDTVPPEVTSFEVPDLIKSLTIPITTFTARDNNTVTGYMITTTATAPLPTAATWKVVAPISFRVTTAGIKTLYAWVKDKAGNVSVAATATVNIDMTKPVVTAFTVTTPGNSLTVPITAISATDASGITGYMVTATLTAPLATAAGWNAPDAPPSSFVFPTAGIKTLYAWAKDSAGNVSLAKNARVNIDQTKPLVTTFTVKTPIKSLTVPVAAFVGSDNTAVTGYMITESSTPPDAVSVEWQAVKPTSYTAATPGDKTLYAWVKDGSGNVSTTLKTAAVTIDTELPQITAFEAPALIKRLTIPITSFTASDNKPVTGYMITLTPTAPLATATTWKVVAPVSFSVTTAGIKTLYAWVKDAAGNVPVAATATVNIDMTKPVMTAFTVTTPVGLTVPITAISATDATGVTGYMVTATSTAPLATAAGWSAPDTPPTSLAFPTTGIKTLYAWAKDGAGNVSLAKIIKATLL